LENTQLKSDSLRNFTVRFLESALRRVESTAKPFYGGRLSTGEAIRRLAEERLDEIENSSPRESERDALLRMVGAWRSGHTLTLSDLRFLAQSANQAYQRRRDGLISRELLVANVSAFRDAVRLSARGKQKGIEPDEQYFVGNLATREVINAKALPEWVDRWIGHLAERPRATQAEFASRNLYSYLRDEEFPDESQLEKTLAQYIPALLQVAIRNYWYEERAPLTESRRAPTQPDPPRMLSRISAGRIALDAWVEEHGVSAAVLMTPVEWGFTLRNFVELEELAAATRLAGEGASDEAYGSAFQWRISGDEPRTFILDAERAWFRLEPTDFTSLRECLDTLFGEPSVAALIERLRYVYGRI
jgi:hypothetical protein